MGKYLLVLVAYDTYKGQPGQVQGHFEKFNREFGQVCEAFLEVTKLEFQLGRKITPVRQYSPSDKNQIDLEQFLERHQLEDLQGILLKEGVTLKILLKMTEEDMKAKRYGHYSWMCYTFNENTFLKFKDQSFNLP